MLSAMGLTPRLNEDLSGPVGPAARPAWRRWGRASQAAGADPVQLRSLGSRKGFSKCTRLPVSGENSS